MELQGTIVKIYPTEVVTLRNGNEIEKVKFVLKEDGEYGKTICVEATKTAVPHLLKKAEGEGVKASINIDSKEYNGKWFTNISAWKIE